MVADSVAILDEVARHAPRSVVEAAARAIRSGEQPTKAVFLARALNALAKLLTDLDERTLGDAAGAPSDYAAILRVLEEPETQTALRAVDPFAPARLRGLRDREQLLTAEGGTLSVEAVASILGITRQGVDKRRRSGRLIGVATGRRGYAYPAWQFGSGGTTPGLEATLSELRGHDAWMQIAFFLNPNDRLGGDTPIARLRAGDASAVCRAARAFGEQGAA